MAGLRIRVLGVLEAEHDGKPVELGPPQQRALLALLIAEAGGAVSTEALIDRLWNGSPPRTAVKSVQKYVSHLRRVLGDGAIVSGAGYRLGMARDEVDLLEFEDALNPSAVVNESEHRRVERALALWHGEPFAEFVDIDALVPVRARFVELWLQARERHHDILLTAGQAAAVAASTERLVVEYPLRERLWHQRILALSRTGRQAEALRAYQQVRSVLAEELGIEPSPELREVEASVLTQDAPSRWDQTASMDRPVRLAPVIGRDEDTSALVSLLTRTRLVTVVGAGGSGKTTLAEAVAAATEPEYPGGSWFIELADLSAGEDVASFVLAALRIPNRDVADSSDQLVQFLANRRALLVLDNCEHLLGPVAALVATVLRSGPGPSVLATSRERLALGGETVYPLDPLEVPPEYASPDEILRSDSVRLLVERARELHPDLDASFQTAPALGALARQLGGLPLALELAAAQLRVQSPSELLERLRDPRSPLATTRRDVSERHRTLDAAMAWSRDALDEEQRRSLDRVAVFRGGFTLTSAAAICERDEADMAHIVGSLADASLVTVHPRGDQPTRYELLEPIRQFSERALVAAGEHDRAVAHRNSWIVGMILEASHDFAGADEQAAGDLLDTELPNVRAVFADAVSAENVDAALRIVVGLGDYANLRLRDEIFDWTHSATKLPGATEHDLHPYAVGSLARGLLNRGERARALELATEVIDCVEEDHESTFDAWKTRASCAIYEGRLDDAAAHSEKAVRVARESGSLARQSYGYLTVVLASAFQEDLASAREQLTRLYTLAEASENPTQIAWSLYAAGEVYRQDDPSAAISVLTESIRIAAEARSEYALGVARLARASLEAEHGDPADALGSFAWLVEHWHRRGDWTHQWNTLRNLVVLLLRLEDREAAGALLDAIERADSASPAYGELRRRLAGAVASELTVPSAPLGADQAVTFALEAIQRHLAS